MEENREPSYYIKNEMERHKINAKELAERVKMSKQYLNKYLNQYERITTKMAIKLADVFPSTTVEYWLKKQMEYDLITIRQN